MTLIELMQAYDKDCEGMLEATEQSVYVSLVLIWNRIRRPEWFKVSQSELMRKAGIKGHHRLERAQDGLVQKGFISTAKGGRTSSRMYKLEPLPTTVKTAITTDETAAVTTDETAVVYGQNDHSYGQNSRKLRPKQPTSQSTEIYTEYTEGGEEPSPSLPQEIENAFQTKIHPFLNPEEKKRLTILVEQHGSLKMGRAIDKADLRGVRKLDYIAGILRSWDEGDEDNGNPRQNRRGSAQRSRYLGPEAEREKWEQAARDVVIYHYDD